MYFFHSAEKPPAPFSVLGGLRDAEGGVGIAALGASRVSSAGPSAALERGRGRGGQSCSRGVVGEVLVGEAVLGVRLGDLATV